MSDEVWYRLEVVVDASFDAADKLWSLGAAGVEVQDQETFMEGGAIAPVPEGRIRLIAFFDVSNEDPESIRERLEEACEVPFLFDRFDDRSWETAWKEYFRPVALSPRSMVGPPWEDFSAPDDGVTLVIEPGMAFGTGTHETTQLVATLLDEQLAKEVPANLLDVGCGSAILSMLARGLGVESVVGIDVDETAVGIAQDTVEANGFDGIRLSTTPIDAIETPYPIVLANILGHILLAIRNDLIEATSPGGLLLASGVTVDQADSFHETFAGDELELLERRDRGEWAAFVYRRIES